LLVDRDGVPKRISYDNSAIAVIGVLIVSAVNVAACMV